MKKQTDNIIVARQWELLALQNELHVLAIEISRDPIGSIDRCMEFTNNAKNVLKDE